MAINEDMIELEKSLNNLKNYTSSIVWFDNESPREWLKILNFATEEIQIDIKNLLKYSDEELLEDLQEP
tara:strand:+ start:1168 stop:1374 length:207 start_codon:yes stop_codon:yes gene_type:complete